MAAGLEADPPRGEVGGLGLEADHPEGNQTANEEVTGAVAEGEQRAPSHLINT